MRPFDSVIDGIKIVNEIIAEKANRKDIYGAQFKGEDFMNR